MLRSSCWKNATTNATTAAVLMCLLALAGTLSLAEAWSFGSLFGLGKQDNGFDPEAYHRQMSMGSFGHQAMEANKKFSWYPTESFEVKTEDELRKVVSAARDGKDVVVFEIFAKWCAHCRKYKDTFEEIASYFNKGYDPEEHESRVIVSRMDCADWDNDATRNLCRKFQVEGFPAMFYGFPDAYLEVLSHEPPPDPEPKKEGEGEEGKEEEDKKKEDDDDDGFKVSEVLRSMPHNARGPPDAVGVISIVEVYLNSELGLPAGTKFGQATGEYAEEIKQKKMEEEVKTNTAPVVYEPPNHQDILHDIEMSTQMSLVYLATEMNLKKEDAFKAFFQWQSWIAKHHPSAKCMKGARSILSNLDDLWPPNASASQVEANLRGVTQCGEGISTDEDDFRQCKEFSCGLWQTFHAMSVHKESPLMTAGTNFEFNNFKAREARRKAGQYVEVQDKSGAVMLSALNSFIDYFFMCMVCRTHFMEVLAGEETKEVMTQRDFVLWLWRSHNVVNKRLGQEELEAKSGDPERPKHIYPNRNECRGCFQVMAEDYDDDSIYTFLRDSYSFTSKAKPARTIPSDGDSSSSGYTDVLADFENPTGEEEGTAGSWVKVGSLVFLIICMLSFLALYMKKRVKGGVPSYKSYGTYKSHYGYTV